MDEVSAMGRTKATVGFLLLSWVALNTVSGQMSVYNAALNKPAKLYPGGDRGYYLAGNAVDGRLDDCSKENTAITDSGNCAWYVDLGRDYHVIFVVITTGYSGLGSFSIRVYKEEPVQGAQLESRLCIQISGTIPPNGQSRDLYCEQPITGRYVRIGPANDEMSCKNGIHLCEVQVMAKVNHDEMSPTGKLGGLVCHNLVSRYNEETFRMVVDLQAYVGVVDHGILTSPSYPNPSSPGENCLWEFRTEEQPSILFLSFADQDVDCRGRSNLLVFYESNLIYFKCNKDENGVELFPNKPKVDLPRFIGMNPNTRVRIMYYTDPVRANGLFHRGVYFVWYFAPGNKTFFKTRENATLVLEARSRIIDVRLKPDLSKTADSFRITEDYAIDYFAFFIQDNGRDDVVQNMKLTIGIEIIRSGVSPGQIFFCSRIFVEGTFDESDDNDCVENIQKLPSFVYSYPVSKFDFVLVYIKRPSVTFALNYTLEFVGESFFPHPDMTLSLDLDAPHPWHSSKHNLYSALANPIRYGGLHYRAVVYQTDVSYDATVDFYITKLVMTPSPACVERYVNIKLTSTLWVRHPSYTYCTTLAPDEVIHVPVIVTRRHQIKISILGSSANSDEEVELTWRVTRKNDMASSYCGKEFLNKAGVIYSPGYPNMYGRGVHCAWTVAQAVPGRPVKTVFQIIEMDMDDVDDLLYVYNRTHSFLVDLCHSKPGDIIQVDSRAGESVHVGFKSGAGSISKGGKFRIKYFANEGVGPEVKSGRVMDVVSSANYPTGYAPLSNWIYRLRDKSYLMRWLYVMDVNMDNYFPYTKLVECRYEKILINNQAICNDKVVVGAVVILPTSPDPPVVQLIADGNDIVGRGVLMYLVSGEMTTIATEGSIAVSRNTALHDDRRYVGFFNASGTLIINVIMNSQIKMPNGDNCVHTLEIEIGSDSKLDVLDLCYIFGKEYFEVIIPSQSLVVFHYKHYNDIDSLGFTFTIAYKFVAAPTTRCVNRSIALSRSERLKVEHWFPGAKYPVNQNCVWTVTANEDLLIQYAIKRIDINGETHQDGCIGDQDYLMVFGEFYCGPHFYTRSVVWRQLNVQIGYIGFIKFRAGSDPGAGQGFQLEIATGPLW